MTDQSKYIPLGMRYLSVRTLLLTVLVVLSGLTSCYTFKGFSVDPELTTFRVVQFRSVAPNAPPNIGQTFTESLKRKISRESRLLLNENNPDIQFDGTVSRYDVRAVSPEPGEFAALQRLEVTVNVEYTNFQDPDDAWSQPFSFFADFSPNQNLLDVQDDLINTIFDQIQEDLFNRAFTNW